jgi:hypothetical protein
LEGISHIMMSLQAVLAAAQALLGQRLGHRLGLARVRTKGIMTSTLVRPMSSRTRLSASHSSSKQREALGDDSAPAPRKPDHRVLFLGLVAPCRRSGCVFVGLEVRQRTMTGLGAKAAARVAMPSASLAT